MITRYNPIIHDHRKPLRSKPKAAVVVRLAEVPGTGEVSGGVAEEADAGGEERLFDAHGLGPGVVCVPVVKVWVFHGYRVSISGVSVWVFHVSEEDFMFRVKVLSTEVLSLFPYDVSCFTRGFHVQCEVRAVLSTEVLSLFPYHVSV